MYLNIKSVWIRLGRDRYQVDGCQAADVGQEINGTSLKVPK